MRELYERRGIPITEEEAIDALGRVIRFMYLTSELAEYSPKDAGDLNDCPAGDKCLE